MNTMNPKPPSPAKGFSLIELLVVVAVIAIMVSMMLPAISGFSSTAGRRGAVTTVMNTFEQSRVAALESGRQVYVLFWRRIFPEPDAIMVLRETEDGTGTYEQLTQWIKLPKNILLHQPTVGSSLLSIDPASVFDSARMPKAPIVQTGESLNVLAFNETGGVAFPTTKANRKLIISEGIRGDGGTEALLSTKKQAQSAGGFEIISLSRYTGRAQLDISTVQ
jgi:prepilin-type N-terminal cleavage/methylation domain-containing protein